MTPLHTNLNSNEIIKIPQGFNRGSKRSESERKRPNYDIFSDSHILATDQSKFDCHSDKGSITVAPYLAPTNNIDLLGTRSSTIK